MAFASTTEWDCRTTGSDSNGGGFDTASTGTDYSKQDSPQVSYTDLVIGATTTQLTSAANPFTSLHVGNTIKIVSGTGFTVQRVQITSVASSIATCDKSCGTASSTGGTGNLGGGLATPATAVGLLVSGNTLWLKNGSYTITAALAITGSNPWQLIGYSSTHGDNGTATITTATNSINLITAPASQLFILRNIILTTTAGTPASAVFENSGTLSIANCSITGFNHGLQAVGAANLNMANCAFTSINAGSAVTGFGGTVNISDSYVYGGTATQLAVSAAVDAFIERTIVAGGAAVGIQINSAGNVTIQKCTIASNVNSAIFSGAAPTGDVRIQSNIIYGNGNIGFRLGTTPTTQFPFFMANNAWGSNTTGNYSSGVPAGAGDVTLTANPFTSSGTGDFSLNSTAGGGTACKGAGFPGAFPGGTTTGHLDIGAAQSSGGGGASGGLMTQGMDGGF